MKPDFRVAGDSVAPVVGAEWRGAAWTAVLAGVGVVGLVGIGLALVAWRETPIKDTLRIGYAVEAPYAFVRDDGEVSGEGPEIARVVAARLGVKRLEWRQVDFSSLIQELRDGSIDVIAAGMFVTPERARVVAFSRPTFRTSHGLLVRRGNPSRIESHADLGRGGRRVAVLAGSVEESYYREILGVEGRSLIVVPDAKSGIRAVQEGVADGLALSTSSLRWAVAQMKEPKVELIYPEAEGDSPGLSSEGAFAFRIGERRLREAWDAELGRFLGSAEHQALVRPFGFGEDGLRGSQPDGKETAR